VSINKPDIQKSVLATDRICGRRASVAFTAFSVDHNRLENKTVPERLDRGISVQKKKNHLQSQVKQNETYTKSNAENIKESRGNSRLQTKIRKSEVGGFSCFHRVTCSNAREGGGGGGWGKRRKAWNQISRQTSTPCPTTRTRRAPYNSRVVHSNDTRRRERRTRHTNDYNNNYSAECCCVRF